MERAANGLCAPSCGLGGVQGYVWHVGRSRQTVVAGYELVGSEASGMRSEQPMWTTYLFEEETLMVDEPVAEQVRLLEDTGHV